MGYAAGKVLASRSSACRVPVMGKTPEDDRSCVPATIQAINPPIPSAWMAKNNSVTIFCREILSPGVPEEGTIFKSCYFYISIYHILLHIFVEQRRDDAGDLTAHRKEW